MAFTMRESHIWAGTMNQTSRNHVQLRNKEGRKEIQQQTL